MRRTKKTVRYAISRRQKRLITALAAVLVLTLAAFDHLGGINLRRGIVRYASRTPEQHKYHLKSFRVVKVVDGDTLDVDIPDGKYNHTRIRLLGIDTPEVGSGRYPAMYFGKEASEYATELVLVKDLTVIIDTIGNTRDKYGRLLAYLRLPDGSILNEILVRDGYAYADLRFPHSQFDNYTRLQEQAIEQKLGLWEKAKHSDLPTWLQRLKPDLLNPKNP